VVAKRYYTGGQYNGKVVLDNYNAMRIVNTEQPIPTTGGVQVVTGTLNQVLSTTLAPEAYCYEIKAGRGGNSGESVTSVGGTETDGEAKTDTFRVYGEKRIWW
jgi:hypothetical protein